MNLAEFSIKKNVITLVFTFILVFGGIKAFMGLSRLEDPEFTIKDAVVATPYPGASAAEVEEEVTNVIEKAVQELGQLERVESYSRRGMSTVKVTIKDKYDKTTLPQVWDELRRKVNDYQRQLPPGAGPSLVNDDYGDVYGVYLALTGEGYTYKELLDVADMLKRELLLVRDVKKIVFDGDISETIYVEMSRDKMAALGISQDNIYNALRAKNLPVDAGYLELGPEYIPINPTGEFRSEQQFGDLLVSGAGSSRLVYLRDVASIRRGYRDPPTKLLFFDGEPAIGLGISTVQGGNVVKMGEALDKRIAELQSQIPIGMELRIISHQSQAVIAAINGFVISLLEAVVIVIIVLLFAMGMRAGLIIGAVLFITIAGTFIFMQTQGIILERISLGALIIALGMLVDNAIVIADGMRVKMGQGEDALESAKSIVGQTAVPLLGATVVAVAAFAAIGTSQDSTGEYCRSLYSVILISLMLSWVTAVTITPLLCKMFLKQGKPQADGEKTDPYAGPIYRNYRQLLTFCVKRRWLTVGVVALLFVASLVGFRFVDNDFFPASTRPQFMVDFYATEGTYIEDTNAMMAAAEKYLGDLEGVTHVTRLVGAGAQRFLLTYTPGNPSSAMGQFLVDVDDYKKIAGLAPKAQTDLDTMFPDAVINVKKFILGPGEGGKIQLRIMGPDQDVLRS